MRAGTCCAKRSCMCWSSEGSRNGSRADASAYPQHVCSAGMLGRKDCADLARCLAEHDGITQHATRMEHAAEHSSATEGSGRLIPQRNVAPGGQTKAWHLSWLQPA